MSRPVRRRPAPPVRHVHLGLGSFFRAHQAWYTHRAPDGAGWGIAAFSGMGEGAAPVLAAQDGVYTLVARGQRDDVELVESVVRAHVAGDAQAWAAYLADPAVTLLTCTVTEAGYRLGADGRPVPGDPAVGADVAALRSGAGAPATAAGRVVAGLAARRAADAGRLDVVSCDNLPGNGAAVAAAVLGIAEQVDPGLHAWAREHVTFVGTMVDRITPRPTPADVERLRALTGVDDPAVVVTEPYAEWVLDAALTRERPAWEAAGALVTPDVERFETRKLRLLNGAHSLLAYAGLVRGHTTVAEAVADDALVDDVRRWWSDAARHLDFPPAEVAAYTDRLLERFGNPAIVHRLDQIAADGSQKIPARFGATLVVERAAGREGAGGLQAVAAWLRYLRTTDAPVADVAADRVVAAARTGGWQDAARALLAEVDGALADDRGAVEAVAERARALAVPAGRTSGTR